MPEPRENFAVLCARHYRRAPRIFPLSLTYRRSPFSYLCPRNTVQLQWQLCCKSFSFDWCDSLAQKADDPPPTFSADGRHDSLGWHPLVCRRRRSLGFYRRRQHPRRYFLVSVVLVRRHRPCSCRELELEILRSSLSSLNLIQSPFPCSTKSDGPRLPRWQNSSYQPRYGRRSRRQPVLRWRPLQRPMQSLGCRSS